MSFSAFMTWILMMLGIGTVPCETIQLEVTATCAAGAAQSARPMHFSNDISNGI